MRGQCELQVAIDTFHHINTATLAVDILPKDELSRLGTRAFMWFILTDGVKTLLLLPENCFTPKAEALLVSLLLSTT